MCVRHGMLHGNVWLGTYVIGWLSAVFSAPEIAELAGECTTMQSPSLTPVLGTVLVAVAVLRRCGGMYLRLSSDVSAILLGVLFVTGLRMLFWGCFLRRFLTLSECECRGDCSILAGEVLCTAGREPTLARGSRCDIGSESSAFRHAAQP
jgi:hypothetical protein